MKVLDLFDVGVDTFASDRVKRSARFGKAAYVLFKHGASKVNPVAIWMDSALAVMDAANSYMAYKQEEEITRQLKCELNSLKKVLSNLKKQLKIEKDTLEKESEYRVAQFDAQLKKMNNNNVQLLREIGEARGSIDALIKVVRNLRQNPLKNALSLKNLENSLDKLLLSQLQCLVQSIDENQ